MSHAKNHFPTVSDAAEALISGLSGLSDLPESVVESLAKLRGSLDQERSRPETPAGVDLARQTIAAIEARQPINQAGFEAVVALAKVGLDDLASFDLRWAADMRAVARWRAGDELPGGVRQVMTDAAKQFRAYEAHHAAKVTRPDRESPLTEADNANIAKARRNGQMAADLEEVLRLTSDEGRALCLPDHADLVVWLMRVLGETPPVPSTAAAQRALMSMSSSFLTGPALDHARTIMGQLIETTRDLARKLYMAKERVRQVDGKVTAGHDFATGYQSSGTVRMDKGDTVALDPERAFGIDTASDKDETHFVIKSGDEIIKSGGIGSEAHRIMAQQALDASISSIAAKYRGKNFGFDVAAEVAAAAPGWEYTSENLNGMTDIRLTRYVGTVAA